MDLARRRYCKDGNVLCHIRWLFSDRKDWVSEDVIQWGSAATRPRRSVRDKESDQELDQTPPQQQRRRLRPRQVFQSPPTDSDGSEQNCNDSDYQEADEESDSLLSPTPTETSSDCENKQRVAQNPVIDEPIDAEDDETDPPYTPVHDAGIEHKTNVENVPLPLTAQATPNRREASRVPGHSTRNGGSSPPRLSPRYDLLSSQNSNILDFTTFRTTTRTGNTLHHAKHTTVPTVIDVDESRLTRPNHRYLRRELSLLLVQHHQSRRASLREKRAPPHGSRIKTKVREVDMKPWIDLPVRHSFGIGNRLSGNNVMMGQSRPVACLVGRKRRRGRKPPEYFDPGDKRVCMKKRSKTDPSVDRRKTGDPGRPKRDVNGGNTVHSQAEPTKVLSPRWTRRTFHALQTSRLII